MLTKNEEKNNFKSISQITLLKYCICLGCKEAEVSNLYKFIDKLGKGGFQIEDLKAYLSNLLEFCFNEEKKFKEKFKEDGLDNDNNSQTDNQIQENIDRIIADFINQIKFKRKKNLIIQMDFNRKFNNHPELFEEFVGFIEKAEQLIFSKVFNFEFDSNNEIMLNLLNKQDEGNFEIINSEKYFYFKITLD